MKVGTFAALLSALLVISARSPAISQTAPLPAPAFHHLHLNSLDPDAAIALLHPAVRHDVEGKLERPAGAQVADQCAGSVQQGRDAARDLAADRDLAFRLARGRFAQEPRALQDPARREAAPALHDGRGRQRLHQQRHLAGRARRARAHQGRDRRGEGQGRAAGPHAWLRLHAGSRRRDHRVFRQFPGRAVQPCAHVPGASVLRAALVPEAPQRAGGAGPRARPRR